jgi:NADPH-dependent curcumin reductase CurA
VIYLALGNTLVTFPPTGSDEKCQWLTQELGFDAAINYETADLESAIACFQPGSMDFALLSGTFSSSWTQHSTFNKKLK